MSKESFVKIGIVEHLRTSPGTEYIVVDGNECANRYCEHQILKRTEVFFPFPEMYSLATSPGLTKSSLAKYNIPLSTWVNVWKKLLRISLTVNLSFMSFCPHSLQNLPSNSLPQFLQIISRFLILIWLSSKIKFKDYLFWIPDLIIK